MEEQIKKLQEELELVKKERDNLILEKKKTFIKTRLNNQIFSYYYNGIKKALLDRKYLLAIIKTENLEIMQSLINDYGYDLVVDCMIELLLKEKTNE